MSLLIATPDTMPVLPMVAAAELELHTPPPAVLLRVVVLPRHKPLAPVMVPADGMGFTEAVVVFVPVAAQLFASVTDKV